MNHFMEITPKKRGVLFLNSTGSFLVLHRPLLVPEVPTPSLQVAEEKGRGCDDLAWELTSNAKCSAPLMDSILSKPRVSLLCV